MSSSHPSQTVDFLLDNPGPAFNCSDSSLVFFHSILACVCICTFTVISKPKALRCL